MVPYLYLQILSLPSDQSGSSRRSLKELGSFLSALAAILGATSSFIEAVLSAPPLKTFLVSCQERRWKQSGQWQDCHSVISQVDPFSKSSSVLFIYFLHPSSLWKSHSEGNPYLWPIIFGKHGIGCLEMQCFGHNYCDHFKTLKRPPATTWVNANLSKHHCSKISVRPIDWIYPILSPFTGPPIPFRPPPSS